MSDNRDITPAQSRAALEFQRPVIDTQSIIDTARDPNVPVEKMERLFALAERMQADRDRREFASAMTRVQSQLAPVRKRGRNTDNGSMHALLEDIEDMLTPIAHGEGFSWSFSTTDCPTPEWMRIVMRLRHNSGHEEIHNLDAPIDNVGPKGGATKTKLHGVGSTFTYIERQLLTKVFSVSTYKDDDGQAAGRGGGDSIDDKQLGTLRDLASEAGADLQAFCKWLGVPELSALPKSQFARARQGLNDKLAAKRRKEAQG